MPIDKGVCVAVWCYKKDEQAKDWVLQLPYIYIYLVTTIMKILANDMRSKKQSYLLPALLPDTSRRMKHQESMKDLITHNSPNKERSTAFA